MAESAYGAFVDGLRKGWQLGVTHLLPHVMAAFLLIEVLRQTGALAPLGKLCEPAMRLLHLPGEAITVLLSAWLSAGGGVGAAASLYAQGALTADHLAILAPGIFLMGAQLQYVGRILAVAGVRGRHVKVLFVISVFNAVMGMLAMRLFL